MQIKGLVRQLETHDLIDADNETFIVKQCRGLKYTVKEHIGRRFGGVVGKVRH